VLTGMLFISESAWARAPAIHVPSTHNDDSAEAHMLAGLCCGFVVLERPPKKQKIKEMKNAQMNSNEMRPGIMNEGWTRSIQEGSVVGERRGELVCLLKPAEMFRYLSIY
jgi:hypothetical protein